MRPLIPLLALAALASLRTGALADESQRWKITPPKGWDDATEKLKDSQIVQGQRTQIEASGLRHLQFWLWTAEDMAPPVRLLQVMTARNDSMESSSAVLDGFAVGMEGSVNGMEESTAHHSKDPYGMTVETSGITSGQHMYMKSIVGIDAEKHLSTATALCFGDGDACHAALASFSFDRTGFQKIDWDGGGGLSPSGAEAPAGTHSPATATAATADEPRDIRPIILGACLGALVLGGGFVLLRTRKR